MSVCRHYGEFPVPCVFYHLIFFKNRLYPISWPFGTSTVLLNWRVVSTVPSSVRSSTYSLERPITRAVPWILDLSASPFSLPSVVLFDLLTKPQAEKCMTNIVDKCTKQNAEYPGLPWYTASKKYKLLNMVMVRFDANDLPAARGMFVSQQQPCDTMHKWMLDELVQCGFTVVLWDRWSAFLVSWLHSLILDTFRTPTAIIDQQDCIICILAGWPQDDPTWDNIHAHMSALLHQAGGEMQGLHKECGVTTFLYLPAYLMVAGKQQVHPICMLHLTDWNPQTSENLVHTQSNQDLINKLSQHHNCVHVAGYMSCACFHMFTFISPSNIATSLFLPLHPQDVLWICQQA